MDPRPRQTGDHQLVAAGGPELGREAVHKQPYRRTCIGERHVLELEVLVGSESHQEPSGGESANLIGVGQVGEIMRPGLSILTVERAFAAAQTLGFGIGW